MKINDPIICKKTDYAGLSVYWLYRIFQKNPKTFLKKDESYYIISLNSDNIPTQVSKEKENYAIVIISWLSSKNNKKEKEYFNKHFYTGIKEIRKNKLIKIFS
jgi:hypothetical protein